MLKRLLSLTAVVGLTLGLASLVHAEEKPKEKPDKPKAEVALMGEVVSVADASVVVKPKEGDKNVTVAVNADTKVRIDGKEAKVGDLKPGMMVAVSNLDGPAKQIKARSHKPENGAKKEKPAKGEGDRKKKPAEGEGKDGQAE